MGKGTREVEGTGKGEQGKGKLVVKRGGEGWVEGAT